MATTTPNFGWPVPTSTDLVKNGATAIEGLGDAIDASLLDLKGGTTGQVLSKATNTDMDFSWVSPTTGDITGVTTASGSGLAGGATSGEVTLTLSSTYSAKTASYTFVNGDQYNLFSMNNAATQQFNIPTDATYNFAVGTEFNVFWITGAGQPTIGAVTPGTTTVISTGATSATPKLRVVNSGATIKKLAANSWIVFGDLA